jgi:hypothetical protein
MLIRHHTTFSLFGNANIPPGRKKSQGIGFAVLVWFSFLTSSPGGLFAMQGEPFDSHRVNEFMQEFDDRTWKMGTEKRSRELDKRIQKAELSVADKVEVFRRLAPSRDPTGGSEELRMTRLLLSIAPTDLPRFKAALEYDGDYKDMVEYLFHDIDKATYRDEIIKHFRQASQQVGIKVLSDVDDTMYANLIEDRYPKKMLYPGVIEFYDALKREPFEMNGIPLTTLSARPNPIAGTLEEGSLSNLVERSGGRLCPSALSGQLVSAAIGTFETFIRAKLTPVVEKIELPDGEEKEIGIVKFKNFANFSTVYPEYGYVFVGDSGQADALTAQLMLAEGLADGASRVMTTFIHDLRQAENDGQAASQAFRKLPPDLIVTRTSTSGRGVIVFRNYIEAAVIAHTHSSALGDLITAEGLARITKAALEEFVAHEADFQKAGKANSRNKLRDQYRQDAEDALRIVAAVTPKPGPLENDVTAIRRILDEQFAN